MKLGLGQVSRRTILLLACGSLAAAAVFVVIALSAPFGSGSPSRTDAVGSQSVTIPRPRRTAPPEAVRPVHRALHALGRICGLGSATAQSARAERPVNVIVEFARRYPNVSLSVHDETGTTLSLLFVARDSVRSCAPSLTGRVERLIPARFLTPTPER